MKYSEGTIEFPILKDMLDLLIQRRIKMDRQYRMKEWTFLDKKNWGHKFLSGGIGVTLPLLTKDAVDFVFSFRCKLLISKLQPPSLALLSRHARRSALAKAGSDMASFADAQFRLRSGELRRTRGTAPCLRLPVRIRTQTGAMHRQAPHAFNPTFLTFFERFFAELLVRTCCLTR